jgi:uncharacterized membrane protein
MPWPYASFEALALLAATCCGVHAYRTRDLPFFATAVAYGVVLEKLVVVGLENYTYPAARFVSVLDIPLAIGLGWSVVLYAGYDTARRIGLTGLARAAFVALFVLHVDLALDAVAIRIEPVGYWTWIHDGAYFGVPIGNFFGWFAVGFSFVIVYDAVLATSESRSIAAGVSLVAASILIYAAMVAFETVAAGVLWRKLLVFGACVAGAAFVLVRASRRDDVGLVAPAHLPAAAVFATHLYFLAALIHLDLHRTEPILLGMSIAMIATATLLHVAPALHDRARDEQRTATRS